MAAYPFDAARPARLSIRPAKYRGRLGFAISGRDQYGRRVRVFAETRTSAEIIKGKLAHDEPINAGDFQS